VSALVMLGFTASATQKVVSTILAEEPELKVEQVIKKALKML
jgi:Holliday junction DNA helicase RuvA